MELLPRANQQLETSITQKPLMLLLQAKRQGEANAQKLSSIGERIDYIELDQIGKVA